MRLVVDEGVPVQVLDPLRRNHGHEFDHVNALGWQGKLDEFLFRGATRAGFEGIVALDVGQLADPDECKRLKRSGLHHVSVRRGSRVQGRKGVARVIASLAAAMPWVLEDLEAALEQRVAEVALFTGGARHKLFDPRREPERYPHWPR